MDEEAFGKFLDKVTGFIWTYAVTNPGVNSLRTPIYAEMVNIVNNLPVEFSEFKLDAEKVRSMFNNFSFTNVRTKTRSMLTWWAFTDDRQELLSLETIFEIEHIYARNRQEKGKSLQDPKNLEALVNEMLIGKELPFARPVTDLWMKRYYKGFESSRGQIKEGSKIY